MLYFARDSGKILHGCQAEEIEKNYSEEPGESFKDNLYNAFEQVGDITENWFGDGEGAQSGLMAASSIIYENIFGKDKIKEINETDFGKWMGTIYTTDTPEDKLKLLLSQKL